MMYSQIRSIFASVLYAFLLSSDATAFVAPHYPSATTAAANRVKPLHLFGGEDHVMEAITTSSSSSTSATSLMSDVNNFLIATIDSDIANVSDDAFGLIFAGGIFVMFGGVLSALIVGFILESRGSYANVIADSYAQGADDEDFWKGLSEEEKRKTQELLQKLKESKEGGDGSSSAPSPKTTVAAAESIADPSTTAAAASAESASSSEPTSSKSTDTKDAGMFSDY